MSGNLNPDLLRRINNTIDLVVDSICDCDTCDRRRQLHKLFMFKSLKYVYVFALLCWVWSYGVNASSVAFFLTNFGQRQRSGSYFQCRPVKLKRKSNLIFYIIPMFVLIWAVPYIGNMLDVTVGDEPGKLPPSHWTNLGWPWLIQLPKSETQAMAHFGKLLQIITHYNHPNMAKFLTTRDVVKIPEIWIRIEEWVTKRWDERDTY
jgi:hypothetical protein